MGQPGLKYVTLESSRGVMRYRFQRKGKKYTLHGEPGTPEFMGQYEHLLEMTGGSRRNPSAHHNRNVGRLDRALNKARNRAGKAGMPATISIEDLREMYEKQDGRCAMTGIWFDLTPSPTSKRLPFSPTLDRIDSRAGYTKENVRLACLIANIGRSDFTDEEFNRMCRGSNWRPQTTPRA